MSNPSISIAGYLSAKFRDFVMEITRQVRTRKFWIDLLVVALGILIYLVAYSFFIYPQRITSGGLMGFCTLITLVTGIPIDIPYNIINISLLVLAFLFLNNNFFIKTMVGVGLLAVFAPIFTRFAVPNPSVESNFQLMILAEQPMVALILGALLIGLGLGLVFSVNGCTGGTDVIVALIGKYKNMSFGRIFMIVDGSIVALSYFINIYFAKSTIDPLKAFDLLVYSIIQVILVSMTLDWYIRANRQSVQFFVFSRKYEEINQAVTQRLHRGCTMLEAKGGYSGVPTKVLMIVLRRRQSDALTRIIEEIDPDAFISQGEVKGVYGLGFESIKRNK